MSLIATEYEVLLIASLYDVLLVFHREWWVRSDPHDFLDHGKDNADNPDSPFDE